MPVSFEPQNDLERSLMKAATDPAHRPQFYRDFMASEIFFIQHGERPPDQHRQVILDKNKEIQVRGIEHKGKRHVPIFSSLERARAVLTGEATCVGVNALDLLRIFGGAPLLLNPGSDYGKEFTEAEVASILDGSLWRTTEPYAIQKPTQVIYGQPKNYPKELSEALCRLFTTIAEVKRAWLAHFFIPERDENPHTLIAIEHNGSWEDIAGQAGIVANAIKVPDPPVEFTEVNAKTKNKGGLEDYFLNGLQPFYKKKRLFGIFG